MLGKIKFCVLVPSKTPVGRAESGLARSATDMVPLDFMVLWSRCWFHGPATSRARRIFKAGRVIAPVRVNLTLRPQPGLPVDPNPAPPRPATVPVTVVTVIGPRNAA